MTSMDSMSDRSHVRELERREPPQTARLVTRARYEITAVRRVTSTHTTVARFNEFHRFGVRFGGVFYVAKVECVGDPEGRGDLAADSFELAYKEQPRIGAKIVMTLVEDPS